MRKLLLSSCMIFCLGIAFAQQFQYEAKIGNPDTAGFYKILLTPHVVAKCSPDLGDIRLVDDNGKQIPYVIKTENPVFAEDEFIAFPIIVQRQEADSLTHVLINNTSGKQLKELVLTIGNTGANRTISVSGSNDSTRWYIIKENIPVEKSYQEKNQFIQVIELPTTNYRFYNIGINGRNLLPVNIIKAGIIQQQWKQASYQPLPDPQITVSNRTKVSYADIIFPDNYQVDQIKIDISAPRFFKRSVDVFGGDTTAGILLGSFTLSSQEPLILPLHFKGEKLRFRIDNEDNPPLEIKSIHGSQLNKYITTYADDGRNYKLLFGDSTLKTPRYDLAFFADSVDKEIKTLSVAAIQKINNSVDPNAGNKQNNTLLWLITAGVLLVLLIITWKMLNEVKRKKEQ